MPKALSKNKSREKHLNSMHKDSFIVISKPDKHTTKKRKLQTNISYEHGCKNPGWDTSKWNLATYKNDFSS